MLIDSLPTKAASSFEVSHSRPPEALVLVAPGRPARSEYDELALTGIGTRATNVALPGVRRLHLGRVRYDLYYRQVDGPPRLEILAFWHSSRGTLPPL